jgi:kynurenine formamidase
VANLGKLPAKGFWIMAFPMKIKGGSGAPLRIVAFLP